MLISLIAPEEWWIAFISSKQQLRPFIHKSYADHFHFE